MSAHGVIAGPAQCRQQRPFADHHQFLVGVSRRPTGRLRCRRPDRPGTSAPAANDLHGIAGSGAIERLGCRCAPVDHQRLILGIAHADPADIADLTVGAVQPAEDQPSCSAASTAKPSSGLEREDIALVQTSAILLAYEGGAI
jgi:hypothetical protein